MKFSEYLKSCRQKHKLTQEELAQELYNFNEDFVGVDTGTISRWERDQTQPSTERQVSILKLFYSLSGHILSCFDTKDKDAIENEICKVGVKNLIGSSKEHILNFPSQSFKMEYSRISQIRSAKNIDKALAMPYSTIMNLTENVFEVSIEQIERWALHPSNFFLLSEYHEQYSGMLFALRLKPNIFKKIINFEMEVRDVSDDDFASFNEMGSNLPITFFAYNDKNSTLLILRYYAHLIANQDVIENVGTTPLLNGAKKIVEKMNMKKHKEKSIPQGTITSYYAPLSDVLINPSVMKMLFQRQDCPQDKIDFK